MGHAGMGKGKRKQWRKGKERILEDVFAKGSRNGLRGDYKCPIMREAGCEMNETNRL